MNSNTLLVFIALLCATVVLTAQLEGSCSISPQDYYGLRKYIHLYTFPHILICCLANLI